MTWAITELKETMHTILNLEKRVLELSSELEVARKKFAEISIIVLSQRYRIDDLNAEINQLRSGKQYTEPDWSKAPEWARWWGQDTCGSQRWFAEEPEEYEAEYLMEGLRGYAFDGQQAIVLHELRLVQRPHKSE